MPQSEVSIKSLPIEWHVPDNQQTRYATNMVVSHGESEFFIYFFEIRSPLIMGTPEEQAAAVEQLDSVRAECVARIAVPSAKMQSFIKALQTNLEKYQSREEIDEVEGDAG